MINEFLGENFTCGLQNSTSCYRTGKKRLLRDCVMWFLFNFVLLSSGTEVLVVYGIPTDSNVVWQWILALLGWWLLYRFLTYLVIEFLQKERR